MSRWTILQWARFYAKHGWSVIPLRRGTKKAAVSWKQYQTTPASDEQLVKWFKRGRYDLGVIPGAVSGNLACRDFDTAEAFEQWKAEHPELVARLLVVKTSRGYHVYFRTSEPCKTKKFEDGELRGEGAYMVLPPSLHPSGKRYEWLTDEDLLSNIPEINPVEAGLVPCNIETESHRNTEAQQLVVSVSVDDGCLRPVKLDSLEPEIQQNIGQAMADTLPKAPGQRHGCLFQFARKLMGIFGRDADPLSLKPLVMRWHQLAESNTSGEHSADDNWQEFCVAWQRVYLPGDGNIVELVLKGLAHGLHPVCAARRYPLDVAVLATACAVLQDTVGDRVFWLSSADALDIIDGAREQLPQCQGIKRRSREWCWRTLQRLVTERVLDLVERGNRHKANKYRFIWTPDAEITVTTPDWLTQLDPTSLTQSS